MASIGLGANAGSRNSRAIRWNGGSLVIGGANPTGGGMSGRPSCTTTPLELNVSVSLAMAQTSSWRTGSQVPP